MVKGEPVLLAIAGVGETESRFFLVRDDLSALKFFDRKWPCPMVRSLLSGLSPAMATVELHRGSNITGQDMQTDTIQSPPHTHLSPPTAHPPTEMTNVCTA